MPWLLIPALALPAVALVWWIRPDPKDIAMHLERYFPSYRVTDEEVARVDGTFGPRRFFADPRRRLAALAMFSAQGSMQIAMVTAPLSMSHHGSTLTAIAFSMSLHTAGMFGPSVPMGWLVDRAGRQRVLIGGTIFEAIGGGITAFSSDHALITMGVILVGLGWCAANVSSTTIVVESTPPNARGASIGMTDSIAAAGGAIFPLCVGPLLDWYGIGATGVLAMLLMAPPAFALARSRRVWLGLRGG
jgi:MFS family permease